MMKPYEKTGRYNKVFYFKDNPKLAVPKGIIFGEKSSLHGYGFFKEAKISKDTAASPPSFEPYKFNSSRIKNKTLFHSVMNNSIIDWREKDFTGIYKGKTYTYVNDRDFLEEEDWNDLFTYCDNNIEFIHSLKTNNYKQAEEFLKLYTGNYSNIILPISFKREEIEPLLGYSNLAFSSEIDTDELLKFIFMIKTFSNEKIKIIYSPAATPIVKNLIKWAATGQISFKDFLGKDFNDNDYLIFKNRLLLKQDPKKMTYKEFKSEYLTF